MRLFLIVSLSVSTLIFSGCTKVDELINGKDNVVVQYPGPNEVVSHITEE